MKIDVDRLLVPWRSDFGLMQLHVASDHLMLNVAGRACLSQCLPDPAQLTKSAGAYCLACRPVAGRQISQHGRYTAELLVERICIQACVLCCCAG